MYFRFSPTRPPVHWSGVRRAVAHGPVCPQMFPPELAEADADEEAVLKRVTRARLAFLRRMRSMMGPERQSEDCLHLNVFVPIDAAGEAEGRGSEDGRNCRFYSPFVSGSSLAGSELLSRRTHVCVVHNLRLPPPGIEGGNEGEKRREKSLPELFLSFFLALPSLHSRVFPTGQGVITSP